MELTQVRYFVAAAQCGSMSKAARQMHVTQPSLSKSVAKLEAEIGCELFDRAGKRIALNEEGRRFLKASLDVLRELDDAVGELRDASGAGSYTRVAVGLSRHDALLAPVLARFGAVHPEAQFSVTGDIDALPSLDINEFDMLLYPDGGRYRRFTGTVAGTERYLLAVPAASPLRALGAVRLSDCEDVEFAFLRAGADAVERPYELCLGSGVRPKARCFTDSVEVHREIIASGLAAGFVREGCATSYRADDRIALVDVDEKPFFETMMVCFKRDKHLPPIGHALKEFVLGAIGGF